MLRTKQFSDVDKSSRVLSAKCSEDRRASANDQSLKALLQRRTMQTDRVLTNSWPTVRWLRPTHLSTKLLRHHCLSKS